MRLVVDTNRLMAALIKDSVSRRILFSPRFEFHTVALLRQEISKHEIEIAEKSSLPLSLFYRLTESLFQRTLVVDEIQVQACMPPAKDAMDSIDPDDTPFIAAALAIGADGIWSDDRHFERQNLVPLFKTQDLFRLL
ncbi:hypothetical protein HYV43_01080 [Candidatus Micrarchaeota archaeon]|nr:hypothetical protein [Candidatus Micrarchaeota archaeon]